LGDTASTSDTVTLDVSKLRELLDQADVSDELLLDIMKEVLDQATVNETVTITVVILEEILDSISVLDETSLETLKGLTDTVSAVDEQEFDITKGLTDIVITLDGVELSLFTIFNQTFTDSATILDIITTSAIFSQTEIDIVQTQDGVIITGAFSQSETDLVALLDQIQNEITKELSDSAIVSDNVDTTTAFGISESDLVIVLDQVKIQFNVTSTQTEVIIVLDQVDVSLDTVIGEIDNVDILDDIRLEITKSLNDVVIINEQFGTSGILSIILSDQVQVNQDLAIVVGGVVIPPTGGGSGGGGAPQPSFQRLVGLLITSEVIQVQPSSTIPSDFTIEIFGQQTSDVFITQLTTEQQFATWIQFSDTPDELTFDITIDNERVFSDPRRVSNVALDDFVVRAPNISCELLDPFDTPQPCIDPILYEVPIEFEFAKGGVKFHEKHTLIIDARVPVEERCILFGLVFPDILCDNVNSSLSIVEGGAPNSIPLLFVIIGSLAGGGMLWWLYTVRSKNVSGARGAGGRKSKRRGDLESMSDQKVRRRFKRGRR